MQEDAKFKTLCLGQGFDMHSMTVIVILGLALAASTIVQALIFFFILRSERRMVKDLLNRLASRTIGEYASATKTLEVDPGQRPRAEAEEGQPIPIFS